MDKSIFKKVNAIQKDIVEGGGLGKNQTNKAQGFKFRGIDDVQNLVAPLLVKHGVIIIPSFSNFQQKEYKTAKGTRMVLTTLDGSFEFRSVEDESTFLVGPIPGEAMDSGDKSTNKAMSISTKYALILCFCIPTEGQDPDADTHDDIAPPGEEQPPAQKDAKETKKPETTNNYEFLKVMADSKKIVGDEAYYRILKEAGFKHANEILARGTQEIVYRLLEAEAGGK